MFKQKRKKVSIDFLPNNYDLLGNYCNIHRCSNSTLINILIESIFSLSNSRKIELAYLVKNLMDKIEPQSNLESSFHKEEDNLDLRCLNDILMLLTDNKKLLSKENFTRIEMKDGYLLIPDNWKVVNEEDAWKCLYAGVIEPRNNQKYKLPHFVFFSESPINELTESDEIEIIKLCKKIIPEVENVQKEEVLIKRDSNGDILNMEEFSKAPQMGFFNICDSEFIKKNNYNPPCGAYIQRTNISESE